MEHTYKKVLFFGIFDPEYARNRVLIRGFEENGYAVHLCRVDPRKSKGIQKYLKLYSKGRALRGEHFDHVIVAFPGHGVVWMARLLFGTKILFDAFLSLYNSNVEDRKLYSSISIGAFRDWFLDWYSVRLSRKILLDTDEHIRYFSNRFSVARSKFVRVLIGADDLIFRKKEEITKEAKRFVVHFHGSFIPLQGIPFIIDAASFLQDVPEIIFSIIGEGPSFNAVQKKIRELSLEKKVVLHGKLPIHIVADKLRRADIALGIFGNTSKTEMVIPNKVYESAAACRAIISADTRAIREVFTDTEDILLCNRSDGKDLARMIRMLYNNPILKEQMARRAQKTFDERCAPRVVVAGLIHEIR